MNIQKVQCWLRQTIYGIYSLRCTVISVVSQLAISWRGKRRLTTPTAGSTGCHYFMEAAHLETTLKFPRVQYGCFCPIAT